MWKLENSREDTLVDALAIPQSEKQVGASVIGFANGIGMGDVLNYSDGNVRGVMAKLVVGNFHPFTGELSCSLGSRGGATHDLAMNGSFRPK
ncbi:hypothetical protein TIFTF001_004256 [Ficus carica]|uniref:Uncharacterized protein n=1 Tax=Ficus carica TaxID=3494 RepID=A0AA88CWW0_FICCA|nr:hypothetical protein TIFTF001_004256 [Ficus carica]